jgi:hypothetical protein
MYLAGAVGHEKERINGAESIVCAGIVCVFWLSFFLDLEEENLGP